MRNIHICMLRYIHLQRAVRAVEDPNAHTNTLTHVFVHTYESLSQKKRESLSISREIAREISFSERDW